MNQRGDLPTGTVTFLFSDIEGSTRLLQNLGDRFAGVLEQHHQLLRVAFVRHGGIVVRTEGDAFFVVFASAPEAMAAAVEAQHVLAGSRWPQDTQVRVRMGLHTGTGALGGDDYVGIDVHRAARIAAAGHGGQVLLSASTQALVEQDLPDGVALRDLGSHGLKDIQEPERLYDVVGDGLARDFPPLRSLNVRRDNLPLQTTEFLGREAELAAIGDLLAAGTRLLTLAGPGGIGKTRLALRAAAEQLDRFDDGVFFVELDAVRDPDGVFEAILRAAALPATPDAQALEAVAQQLETRHVLLVLDNLEQVIAAARGVAELLARCPGVGVLATSREALAVRGEHVFAVPPLSLPPQGMTDLTPLGVAQFEAVRLFVARAQQAREGFALTDDNAAVVADICARLDGLPLAIELAAARVKLFSPHELRDRLDSRLGLLRGGPRDVPARQRTLRGAIAWSYELLDAGEQSLFGLLSLFSTARVDSVEDVAARIAVLRDEDVLDLVTSLVDKSLVRSVEEAGVHRLVMLETIREFAAERLAEQPTVSDAAARAHAEHFCAVARAARRRLDGAEQAAALDELEAEIGNLRTAWRYWLESGDLAELGDLLETLWVLHDARGWYRSAVELAQDLLTALSAVPSTPDRVEQKVVLAVSAARGLLAVRGYTQEVDEAYRAALDLLTEAEGLPQLFPVLRSLASIYLYRAEFDKAAEIGRQLLDLAEQEHDTGMQVEGHLVLGVNLASMGGVEDGRKHLEQAIELFDRGGQRPARFRLGASPGVVARTTSAFHMWLLGSPSSAVARADEALTLARRLNHPFTLAYTLYHVGLLALWRDAFEIALQRAGEALQVATEHDYEIWRALAQVLQGTAMTGRGEAAKGLAQAGQGIELYQGLDAPPVFWPLLLAMRAKSYALAGRPDEGLGFIDQAMESFGGRFNILYPEMPLLKGDMLLAASGPQTAEPLFEHAYDVSAALGARMTQLRAATRLTRLRRAAGRQPDGADRLQVVYAAFTEGWEIRDLVAARAVLDDVGA